MTMVANENIVLTEADSRFDQVVEGVSGLGVWSLWLLLDRSPIQASAIRPFMDSFAPASLWAWHVTDGGARSPAIKGKLRAFGGHGQLVDRPTSRLTLEVDGTTYFSDTATLTRDYDSLAAFLSRSTSGSDSALAILPDDLPKQNNLWAAATLPLLALWLARSLVLATPSLGDRFLLSFLAESSQAGAVPLVLFYDPSLRPALTAFGTRDSLANAAAELNAANDSNELSVRLSRGMRPQSLP